MIDNPFASLAVSDVKCEINQNSINSCHEHPSNTIDFLFPVEEGTQGLHFCRLVPLVDDPMDDSAQQIAAQFTALSTQIIGSVA